MTWNYNKLPYTTADLQYRGFVYLITNYSTGKQYIGQKVFWNRIKRAPLKGKTNRRHSLTESDWQTYWGSNDQLIRDVATLGEQSFDREILYLCENKNQMNYFEAKEQFDRSVLFSDKYYNGIISCRISNKGLNPKNK
jgi:hypothetical protein